MSTTPRLPSAGNSGQSSNSYIFARLLSSAGSLRMPQNSSLAQAQINYIQDWIDQGVQNN